MLIEQITSPNDIKALDYVQLGVLADEIRTIILNYCSIHGGHVGPNLGMVEMSIAIHYVFNSPQDKILFDVSHQIYTHKMLTGRAKSFLYETHYKEVGRYSNPLESEHDLFIIGHTSTSISLATGIVKARDLLRREGNVIAVIGDGALCGGEASEGLNIGGMFKSNLIIIINDNQMSIANNYGGLYRNLEKLRTSAGTCNNNYFRALGYDYIYVPDGNNLAKLIHVFKQIKDIQHPIVVHVNTEKGYGYNPAIEDKEKWHFIGPFDIKTGKKKDPIPKELYSTITADYLLKRMEEDERIVAISAGTPTIMGFTTEKRKRAGKQFIDVGAAEEHAVAMACGIAKAGGRPVWGVYSCFITRANDQIQDLCINNSPAIILIFWGSLIAMNDVTHLCWWDIPLMSNIPNMVCLSPTNKEEYIGMLDWSIAQSDHPVCIRVPFGHVVHSISNTPYCFSEPFKYEVRHWGEKVALFGVGHFINLADKVAKELKETYSIDATVINPRNLSHQDVKLLNHIKTNHLIIVTLEDGLLDGGFGEKIARFFATSSVKVICRGGKKNSLTISI